MEEGDAQVSLTWNDLDKKRVEEEYCEGCKTKELRESVGRLIEKLLGTKDAAAVEGFPKSSSDNSNPVHYGKSRKPKANGRSRTRA